MNTLLVTGGAGFVGSCFVRQWMAEEDSRLVNLDKLTYAGNIESLAAASGNPRHVFVQGDIGDRQLVDSLLREYHPSAIVNFAAESHVDRSIDGPAPFVETNVLGVFAMLEAATRYWSALPEPERSSFRFLQVSTDEVFGELVGDGRFREDTPYAPSSPYSASKAAGDHFCRAYHRTYGLPVLTTHACNNYGPYQFPEKLLPLMILNALEGRPLPVYGDGRQVRDWLHVEDHCRAIRAVLDKGPPGETFCIGADCQRTNLQVIEALCGLVDRLRPDLPHRPCASLIRFVDDRPGHDRCYAVDAGKICRTLGWKPRQDFESGLEATVRWYIEHRPWAQGALSGKYACQRLGAKPTDRFSDQQEPTR